MADFGIKEAGTMDISCEDLEWKDDRGSPLGSGSFASVYRGTSKLHEEEKPVDVAPKVWKKALTSGSAISFLSKTDTLRLAYAVLQFCFFLCSLLCLVHLYNLMAFTEHELDTHLVSKRDGGVYFNSIEEAWKRASRTLVCRGSGADFLHKFWNTFLLRTSYKKQNKTRG